MLPVGTIELFKDFLQRYNQQFGGGELAEEQLERLIPVAARVFSDPTVLEFLQSFQCDDALQLAMAAVWMNHLSTGAPDVSADAFFQYYQRAYGSVLYPIVSRPLTSRQQSLARQLFEQMVKKPEHVNALKRLRELSDVLAYLSYAWVNELMVRFGAALRRTTADGDVYNELFAATVADVVGRSKL